MARRIKKSRRRPRDLPVDVDKLNMGNTYDSPPERWEDRPFTCRDCGAEEVWTAQQQKWWYEEAGGYFFARAIRCRPCRKKERDRVAEARRRAGHDSGD